jgi:fructokinase
MPILYGAIEAGGTTFVCGVGSNPADLVTLEIPTTSFDETLAHVIAFFRSQPPMAALGLATFGPIELDPARPLYGHITSTPKPGWQFVDLFGRLRSALGIPIAFDTDVNAALLGESAWGAAQGLTDALYLTVGTGIGGAALVNGRLVHGLLHPEMGHILIRRHPDDAISGIEGRVPFPGCCPFHGDCLEGLASGPSLAHRWQAPAESLAPDHPAWEFEANYLAQAVVTLTMAYSPQRIILGGGVLQQTHLFPRIRNQFVAQLAGYLTGRTEFSDPTGYLVPAALAQRAGVLGALKLAALQVDKMA